MITREGRLTEAAPDTLTKGCTDSISESALTFEDRQAAIAVAFEAGTHYQAGLDVEDRSRALLHAWATESRDMAKQYARAKGPAWAALIAESGDRE